MANNKLSNLNDHLFAEIERLGNEETKGQELKEEIERAKAIALISKNIVDNAKTVLAAANFVADTNAQDDSIKRLTN